MMRKLKIVLLPIFLCFCISFWNCSPGGDSIFIPAIDAVTWVNQANSANEFFFFDIIPPNSNTSTFNGNDNIPGESNGFSGSFTNHNIEFTYNSGNKNGKKYSGTIDNDSKVMVLSGQGLPNLRLEKQ